MARARSYPQPWQQSDVDRLCGLVTLVNLVRYLAPEKFTRKESEDLFAAIAEFLLVRGHLKRVIRVGMYESQFRLALAFVVKHVAQNYGIRLRIRYPYQRRRKASLNDLIQDLREFLGEPRQAAAVISFHTVDYGHYTVVRGISAAPAFLLSDSSGHTRLPLKSCTVDARKPSKKHRYVISAPSTILVSKVDR